MREEERREGGEGGKNGRRNDDPFTSRMLFINFFS